MSVVNGTILRYFTGENLAYNNSNNDEAEKMRWAMLLQNKRLIISNELSTNKNLDSVVIRKLASGGDTIKGRLHGQIETDFIPQFMTLILANDMPPIVPFDGATRNRSDAYSLGWFRLGRAWRHLAWEHAGSIFDVSMTLTVCFEDNISRYMDPAR